MMKWSYKTVHFELKKEGLLGSGFLDEPEIEQELNEYGQGGWELVSVLEVQDGIIAFFKQPLNLSSVSSDWHEEDVRITGQVPQEIVEQAELPEEESADMVEVSRDKVVDNHSEQPSKENSRIGAIRIE